MGTSLTLFRAFDIDVRVHWSFVLILAYGAFFLGDRGASGSLFGMLFGVLVIVLLFVCVTLHEFGHALVAKYFNVKVPHITLLPIGGVASLERIPDKPVQEFLIAIAGPAVNFAIALLLLPVAAFLTVLGVQDQGAVIQWSSLFASFQALLDRMQEPSLSGIFISLLVTNILLGLFNLLPAFPMDGGRILRALLAMIIPYVQATRIAVFVGRIMAVLFFLAGIFQGNVFLMLIAFFVYVGGGSEREAVESRAVLRDIKAGDALTPSAVNLFTSEQASRAVELIMHSYQTDYAVFDLSNQFVGVLTRTRLIRALQQSGPDARIKEIMLPAERVPTSSPTTDLATIWEKMAQSGSRVIAIKEKNDFLGLITIDDITEVFQVVGAAKDGIYRRKSESQPQNENALHI